MSRSLMCCLGLLAMALPIGATAEDEPTAPPEIWYQVEVIAFKHLYPNAGPENWEELPLVLPSDTIAIMGPDGATPQLLRQALQLRSDAAMIAAGVVLDPLPDPMGESAMLPVEEDEWDATGPMGETTVLPSEEGSDIAIPGEDAAGSSTLPDGLVTDAVDEALASGEEAVEPLIADAPDLPQPNAPLDLGLEMAAALAAMNGALVDEVLAELDEAPFVGIPAGARRLEDVARSMRRSRPYRILMHTSWRQPLTEKPTNVQLQAGEQYGDRFELEGVLSLWRSRFLHASVDLRFYEFEETAMLNDRFAPIEPEETTADEVSEPYRETDDADERLPEPIDPALYAANDLGRTHRPAAHYALVQTRRMRSGTVHYIDHPYVGIVIRIDEYELPLPEEETLADDELVSR